MTPPMSDEARVEQGAQVLAIQQAAIVHIAKTAHMIGWQAGVGGMETAGAIVSYLANHPDQIEPFFRDEVSPVDWPDFVDGGCLIWHAAKGGKLIHPSDVRTAKGQVA